MLLAKSILIFKLFVILIPLLFQIVDEIRIPCADPEMYYLYIMTIIEYGLVRLLTSYRLMIGQSIEIFYLN